MKYITVGEIVNTFGIRGELKVNSLTDFEQERFAPGKVIYVYDGTAYRKETIRSYRRHKGMVLLAFAGKENINLVEADVGATLHTAADEIQPLAEGEYFFRDLKGLQVVVDGQLVGMVADVMESPAHPILRIKTPQKTTLVPFVEAFVQAVDLDGKTITITPIEGML